MQEPDELELKAEIDEIAKKIEGIIQKVEQTDPALMNDTSDEGK